MVQISDTNFSDANLQILHVLHEVGDHAPSALLTVGDERLCFNCAEGFQRCSSEGQPCMFLDAYELETRSNRGQSPTQIRISKLSNFLFTRVSFRTCSGLPGTLLTSADAAAVSHSTANIIGPSKLGLFMNSIVAYSDRSFDALQLEVNELRWPSATIKGRHHLVPEPVVNTSVVAAHAILLRTGDSPAAETDSRKRQRDGEDPLIYSDPGSSAPAALAVLYVCKMTGKRGKFLKDKAIALGVARGPDFGRLARGETVTSATTGQQVSPSMCLEDPIPGEVIAIVECPTLAYVPALHSANSSLAKVADDGGNTKVKILVHLTAHSVADTPEYQTWVDTLPDWLHVMAGLNFDAAGDAPSLYSSHQMQSKLHLLHPTLFLDPRTCECRDFSAKTSGAGSHNDPPPVSSADVRASAAGEQACLHVAAEPLQPGRGGIQRLRNLEKLVLRPINARGLNSAQVHAPSTRGDVQAKLAESPEAVAKSREVLERLASNGAASSTAAGPGDSEGSSEPHVVLLGTGAACPSKYRNVTALFADFGPQRGGMLIDCGEGTWGQLVRAFGREGAEQRLRELRCVWLSHRHADHHVGLPLLLALRKRLLPADSQPIPIFGPWPLRRVLSACNKIESLHYTWVDQYGLTEQAEAEARGLQFFWDEAAKSEHGKVVLQQVCKDLGLESMQSVIVHHCKHSFALVLRSKDGWSFAFSGDTQKCDALAQAAKDVTIFVHEATFENGLEQDAQYKKHSTVNDALEVGKVAQCQSLVLTHFSQRYPKVPDLSGTIPGSSPDKVGIGYDLMRLSLSDIDAPAAMVPVLSDLFKDVQPADVPSTELDT